MSRARLPNSPPQNASFDPLPLYIARLPLQDWLRGSRLPSVSLRTLFWCPGTKKVKRKTCRASSRLWGSLLLSSRSSGTFLLPCPVHTNLFAACDPERYTEETMQKSSVLGKLTISEYPYRILTFFLTQSDPFLTQSGPFCRIPFSGIA